MQFLKRQGLVLAIALSLLGSSGCLDSSKETKQGDIDTTEMKNDSSTAKDAGNEPVGPGIEPLDAGETRVVLVDAQTEAAIVVVADGDILRVDSEQRANLNLRVESADATTTGSADSRLLLNRSGFKPRAITPNKSVPLYSRKALEVLDQPMKVEVQGSDKFAVRFEIETAPRSN